MRILFATHNPAKLQRYKNILNEFTHIELISLKDIGISQKVEEPFPTSKENAIYKAKEYAQLSHLPTLAVDEAVNTNFLPKDEQPGVYVRRYANKETTLTDEEMLHVWKEIFKEYPQKDKQFIWEFSIAFYNVATSQFHYTRAIMLSDVAEVFSKTRQKGYPMSSFLTHKGTNKPYAELSETEKLNADKETLKDFIKEFPRWIKP